MSDPAILRELQEIKAMVKQLLNAAPAPTIDPGDLDLDGKFGDPEVRFDPRNWRGESQVGKRFSECPSAFLLQLAKAFDYFATKPENQVAAKEGQRPPAYFNRLDAGRARAWSERNKGRESSPLATEKLPF